MMLIVATEVYGLSRQFKRCITELEWTELLHQADPPYNSKKGGCDATKEMKQKQSQHSTGT
jgi:hypothetical protein